MDFYEEYLKTFDYTYVLNNIKNLWCIPDTSIIPKLILLDSLRQNLPISIVLIRYELLKELSNFTYLMESETSVLSTVTKKNLQISITYENNGMTIGLTSNLIEYSYQEIRIKFLNYIDGSKDGDLITSVYNLPIDKSYKPQIYFEQILESNMFNLTPNCKVYYFDPNMELYVSKDANKVVKTKLNTVSKPSPNTVNLPNLNDVYNFMLTDLLNNNSHNEINVVIKDIKTIPVFVENIKNYIKDSMSSMSDFDSMPIFYSDHEKLELKISKKSYSKTKTITKTITKFLKFIDFVQYSDLHLQIISDYGDFYLVDPTYGDEYLEAVEVLKSFNFENRKIYYSILTETLSPDTNTLPSELTSLNSEATSVSEDFLKELEQYRKLGSVSDLKDRLNLLGLYESLGTYVDLSQAITLSTDLIKKYQKLGTLEEINHAIDCLKEYSSLCTIKEFTKMNDTYTKMYSVLYPDIESDIRNNKHRRIIKPDDLFI